MRNIDLRSRLGVRTKMLHIAYDPDDLAELRSLGAAEIQSLADWILVGPEAARHRSVDSHHWSCLQPISSAETAAIDDGNFHRAEVTRVDCADVRDLIISRSQGWTSFDSEAHASPMSGERQVIRDRRRLNPGQRLNAFDKLFKKIRPLLFVRIFHLGQGKAHGEHIVRVKSEAHFAKVPKAFNHQSGANQQ